MSSSGRLRHIELIVLLGAMTAFTPMSIDMYLPALPLLGDDFGATPGHIQFSIASFFLGIAVGQAFYGPLSDRFGRTRPLYGGLALFVLASIACALAPSVDVLIVARFFQALGACAGTVISRAMVRDLFEPREAVQVFSLLLVQVTAGVLLFAGAWSGILQLYGVTTLLFIYVASIGCLFPNITAMAGED